MKAAPVLPQPPVSYLLLDLDGTLLDAHFDDYFWEDFLPNLIAKRDGMTPDAAREKLLTLYNEARCSLRWADVEYWSERLAVDIVALKRRQAHLIRPHDGALDFLARIENLGANRVLVTDAHPKTLALKLEKVDIGRFFDTIIRAEDLGAAKTEALFWQRLAAMGYDLGRSFLIDDNLAVLRQARRQGVGHCAHVTRPNSRRRAQATSEFFAVASVADLSSPTSMPFLRVSPKERP
ncbi:MAG: HAD hydrolase-like protein [Desulfobulbaceae bacterium]|jgi:putative hydrolase of the HAD superfamily|nr:HAD hydrolase-like protein [Desulfobulbaceae bacterium]